MNPSYDLLTIFQALRIARNESSVYGDIADYTKGIVFFGTPHRGADAAKWADSIAAIISSASFRRWFRLPLLRVLKPNSKDLIDISEDFRSIVSNYAIVSFIEDEIFPGSGRVVSSIMLIIPQEWPIDQITLYPGRWKTLCCYGGFTRGSLHSRGKSFFHM